MIKDAVTAFTKPLVGFAGPAAQAGIAATLGTAATVGVCCILCPIPSADPSPATSWVAQISQTAPSAVGQSVADGTGATAAETHRTTARVTEVHGRLVTLRTRLGLGAVATLVGTGAAGRVIATAVGSAHVSGTAGATAAEIRSAVRSTASAAASATASSARGASTHSATAP